LGIWGRGDGHVEATFHKKKEKRTWKIKRDKNRGYAESIADVGISAFRKRLRIFREPEESLSGGLRDPGSSA